MTVQTVGEVSWDNAGAKSGKSDGKDSWMHLDDGPNTVRIVTNPHQYLVHKSVKKVGDKGYGQKINCALEDCPLCKLGHPVSTRWYIGVIDRKSNSFKILDVGGSIVYSLKEYNKNIRWGDPKKYDVDIIRNSKADPQHYYSIQPVPHAPLSATDQKIIDEADLEYLKRKTVAPTADQVQDRVNKILEGQALFIPEAKPKNNSKKVGNVAPEVDMADDGDDIFPAHQSATA